MLKSPHLIQTGTGKELFARAVHYNGKNKNSPFVDIACSALPETLLESELFGYEKGAFTDAKEKKIGLFELAGDGTIFLDEIGDISLATQSKLLKVIEDRTMRRVAGARLRARHRSDRDGLAHRRGRVLLPPRASTSKQKCSQGNFVRTCTTG